MIKNLRPRLAEAGKIKTGGLGEERTSKSGKLFRLPVKYDHFKITKTNRDPKGDLEIDEPLLDAVCKWAKCEPNKLRSIPVVVHSDSIEDVFPTSYALYAGKRLRCRGDGEEAERWEVDAKGQRGDGVKVVCPCEQLETRECKAHATFHCSIRLSGHAVAGAVHRWRTTSVISIEHMIASIEQIESVFGGLQGLPMILNLSPVDVTPDGKPTKVYCCHLEVRTDDMMALQQRMLEMARMRREIQGAPTHSYHELVSAPAEDETLEDEEQIQQEFHPEEQPKEEPAPAAQPAASPPHDPQTGEVLEPDMPAPDALRAECTAAWRNMGGKDAISWDGLCRSSLGITLHEAPMVAEVQAIMAWIREHPDFKEKR